MQAPRFGVLAAALALGAAAPAAAQVPLTPRALGMGGAYVGVARGQEALFQNPANLALPNSPHWSFAIPTASVGYSLLGIDVGDAFDISDYGGLDQDERDAILDRIPESGTELRGDVRIPLAAVQLRRFAFGLSYATLGSHTVDRDIVDLLLNGPVLGRNDDVTPPETQGFRATYVDVAGAYARRFGPVSVGATAHYYHGVELVRAGITAVQPVALPVADVLVRYSGVSSEGGSGFGLDLGAAYQPTPAVTVSASISNLVNTFEWDEGLTRRFVELNRDDYQSGDLERIWEEYNDSEAEYSAAASLSTEIALAEDLEVDTDLPRVFRAGVAWQPLPNSVFSAAYQGSLEDSRVGGMWDKSLGIGWQQRVRFLSLRAGVASNLDDGSLLSAGLSLGPLNLGIARLSDGEQDGADRKGWITTIGLSARSNSVMP